MLSLTANGQARERENLALFHAPLNPLSFFDHFRARAKRDPDLRTIDLLDPCIGRKHASDDARLTLTIPDAAPGSEYTDHTAIVSATPIRVRPYRVRALPDDPAGWG